MKKIVLAVALVMAFSAKDAIAQTAAATLTGTVEQSLYISLDQTEITFANADAADFNAGLTEIAGGTLTHKGNVTHSVTVLADAATMTGTGTAARLDKPASDVKLKVGAGTPAALSNTVGEAVATAAAAGEYTKTLAYQMALAWANDTPGTYSLGVTYTIAAD